MAELRREQYIAKFIGQLVNLGIARESSRGTGVDPVYWVPRTALSFQNRAEKAIEMESLGVLDDADAAYVVSKFGEGAVEGHIRDKSFGLFLYALLGTANSANVSGTTYDHTFTLAASNQHQSLTFTVDDPIADNQFKLVMLNTLEISAVLNEIVQYNASFISQHSVGATVSKSYVAENKFTAKHANVKIAANLAALDAASNVAVKNFRITFNKNLMRDHDLGTVSAIDILNQSISVEGQLELLYEDNTYRDYMLDGTYKALRLDLLNTDVSLDTGNPRLQINLPRVHFYDWEADYTNDQIAKQTVSFKALYDLSGANNLVSSIVLRNQGVTSY